jgi:hypothetical protein
MIGSIAVLSSATGSKGSNTLYKNKKLLEPANLLLSLTSPSLDYDIFLEILVLFVCMFAISFFVLGVLILLDFYMSALPNMSNTSYNIHCVVYS